MHVRKFRFAAAASTTLAATVAATLVMALVTAPTAAAFQEPAAAGFDGESVDLTDIVRIAPGADGKQIAPQLEAGKTSQAVPDLQIKLPIKTEASKGKAGKQFATWQPGDVLTVTLPSGVTFAAAPTVTSSGLVDVNDPATPMTASLSTDSGADVTLEAPKPTGTLGDNKSTFSMLISNSQWGGVSDTAQHAEWLNLASAEFSAAPGGSASPTPGFVLRLSGLKLDVAKGAVGTVTATVAAQSSNGFYGKPEYATYPAQAPVACTVGTAGGTRMTSYIGGTTTLGLLPPLSVSAAQPAGQVLEASGELQGLPKLRIDGAFATGVGYQLTGSVLQSGADAGAVLFDFPTHRPRIDYMDTDITTTGAVSGVSLAPSAGQYSVTRAAALTMTAASGGNGTVSLAGLRIAGYVPTGQSGAKALPAGSTVAITVAVPTGTDLAVNDAATTGCLSKAGASTYSEAIGAAGDASARALLRVAKTANRIAGLNRYDTAARLAMRMATAPGAAPITNVVVANGETRKGGFDALAANYLAGRVGAPILLTAATALPDETALALRAMLAGAANPTIYVMGKADSVSDAVVDAITAIGKEAATGTVTVKRVAGDSRYATAALAAGYGTPGAVSFAKGSPKYTSAILASGVVSADALAAGPLSFSMGLPVLLTSAGAKLPPEVAAFVKKAGVKQIFVLGGQDRVTPDVLSQLRSLGVEVVKRIAGPNRFATSADLYEFATASAATDAAKGGGLGWAAGPVTYLANGVTGFPDALAVGPLAGSAKSVLLTTGPTKLDPTVAAQAKGKTVVGLGQPATVPDGLL